ncbi:hypothetical protein OAF27_00550 [Verrucomicrobiales bacterium]|nr:hypothetical protein [Verrucomicrobiales bacterium]
MKPNTHSQTESGKTVPPPGLRYRLTKGIMSPILKLCGLSCRQFAELAAVRLDRPLKLQEALRFRMHRIMCGVCRPLPQQLENLRKLTRCACEHGYKKKDTEAADDIETPEGLSASAKQKMRALLAEEP